MSFPITLLEVKFMIRGRRSYVSHLKFRNQSKTPLACARQEDVVGVLMFVIPNKYSSASSDQRKRKCGSWHTQQNNYCGLTEEKIEIQL